MAKHHWVHAGEAASKVLADITVRQMADVLNDWTVDLDRTEDVGMALRRAGFQHRLITPLLDRAVAKARSERTWHHAQAAS